MVSGQPKALCMRAIGIQIQRERERASIRRVDPVGVELRLRIHLHQRTYRVPCPNYLWHIDGYDKLFLWRFVIHGYVDGYSRIPVFLNVSSNNKSTSALNAFIGAVFRYGVPMRVRADHGENVRVERFMSSTHAEGLNASYMGGVFTISVSSACGATCSRVAPPGSTES